MKHKHAPQSFRRFLMGWIGIHLFCTVLYFVFHSLCFVGGTVGAGLRYDSTSWIDWLQWDMYATLAPTFAVMPTLVILSLLQSLVSQRTIDVLPRSWLRVTTAAYTVGYLIVFVGLFQAVAENARNGLSSDLTTLFTPLYFMFGLMVVVESLCLLRYGALNVLLWGMGTLVPLLILIPFNNDVHIYMGDFIFNFYPLLIVYPILLSIITAALCWRYWKHNDLRKRHAE